MAQALNIARWIERSAVNGPGERFVLWLQGCPLRCPGCWNPDTWDFRPRQMIDPQDLITLVSEVSGIEGVTLTGGEPFSQAAALIPVVRALRHRGCIHGLHWIRTTRTQKRAGQEIVGDARYRGVWTFR